MEGRVIKSFGNRFIVQTEMGTLDCGLRGRMRLDESHTGTPVAVGDNVVVALEEAPHGVIESVLPRRNRLSRPDVHNPDCEQILVANCDQLVVVAAVAKPRLKHGAIDRFLLCGEKAGLRCLVVLNKIDLAPADDFEPTRQVYANAGYPVLLTSALEGLGLDGLKSAVQSKTSIFAGHSGVGKSSLLNALQPGLKLRTREVSYATARGTHTTTRIELHPLDFGGFIADTPGLRAIGLWQLAPEELPHLYPEFTSHLGTCRFDNCCHVAEPGCGVKEAVGRGTISPERYEGYLRIRESLQDGD